MGEVITGGCQCRRIRFAAEVDGDNAYLCHCGMCRRATGGASIALISVALEGLAWTHPPEWYRSSPIAERPFCAACGTPLGFRFVEGATRMDLTLGAFDAPERFRPVHNYAVESMLPAWRDVSHLPGIRSDENENVTERWIAACGKLPD